MDKRKPVRYSLLGRIKLLVLDFDGVLTDNRVLIDEAGKEYVVCHRSDGIGLANLRKKGIGILVLSSEINRVVTQRCKKLKVDYIQSCKDKCKTLKIFLKSRRILTKEVAYMGNDINDIECMRMIGFSISVVDAHPDAKRVARLITRKKGGYGAVREICDLIVNIHSKAAKKVLKKYD